MTCFSSNIITHFGHNHYISSRSLEILEMQDLRPPLRTALTTAVPCLPSTPTPIATRRFTLKSARPVTTALRVRVCPSPVPSAPTKDHLNLHLPATIVSTFADVESLKGHINEIKTLTPSVFIEMTFLANLALSSKLLPSRLSLLSHFLSHFFLLKSF